MTISAIVTIPPYAPFIREVAAHPIVSGLRLNTVMPVKEPLDVLMKRLQDDAADKDVWIDLKSRQLRVAGYWVPPYTEIEISHKIKVNTPTTAYFNGGEQAATLVGVNGNRLLMLEGPRRVVGPGEAINIPDSSLEIEGFLTETDLRYIEAGKKISHKKYMLSFVESGRDIDLFRKVLPDADLVAKIENEKGIAYVNNDFANDTRLMAARGDLFVEMRKPHLIIRAVEDIIRKDPGAIAASRIFGSLASSYEPSCEDIGDVDNLLRMGYRTLMLGDDVCMKRNSVISALNLLHAMSEMYA